MYMVSVPRIAKSSACESDIAAAAAACAIFREGRSVWRSIPPFYNSIKRTVRPRETSREAEDGIRFAAAAAAAAAAGKKAVSGWL